jgi:cellulose synthase/poly-beta-1,6-N-acetylglucosamine synthase-like glycosyltransferase
LYVYNEDNFTIKVDTVTSVGWKLGTEYEKFQKRHSNERVKVFAKKAFSIIHAMEHLNYDKIIWLDADTIISDDIPMQLIDLISPNDVLSTHFSVWHEKDKINYHSCETGFFILNKTHPSYQEFCNTYKDIYVNDKTETLRRFYDGEVYGKTVEIMESQGHKMLNLNPNRYKTPISRSVLAPYITHYKAGLKNQIDFANLEL